MSAALGWVLAVLAIAAGYVFQGWPGVVLAITVVVFWLLLQFNRALGVLRRAGASPVGQVDSAVMLQARLRTGMRLTEVLALTRSLGRRLGDEPEAYAWADAGGDAVHVELRAGRVSAWQLQRAAPPGPGGPDP